MKIFISHASANKNHANAFVELLRNIGIKEGEIIYTSNTVYGIPTGKNIFDWLKTQISEKPFVIYLLSREYYLSIVCLNEMGAAWIVENEHAVIFTPNFDIACKEFQSGVLDPREMGFYMNEEDKILLFIQQLGTYFDISKNPVLINQILKTYLSKIESLENIATQDKSTPTIVESAAGTDFPKRTSQEVNIDSNRVISNSFTNEIKKENNLFEKFTNDIIRRKLKNDELILLHYIIDTAKIKLLTGWQEEREIEYIKEWETVKELNNELSKNYSGVIRRFELRGYTEVSALTGGGKPKEIKLNDEIVSNILELPQRVLDIINDVIDQNKAVEVKKDYSDGLPF